MRHRLFLLLPAVLLLFATLPDSGRAYEQPPKLKASQVLPKKMLKGPYFEVQETVTNNGFTNQYTVKSPFGTFKPVSTMSLGKLLPELVAIAALRKADTEKVAENSMQEAGEGALSGLKNLFTNTGETVQGAVSGLGKVFDRAGEAMRSKKSDTEGSALENIAGYSKTKREIAVDYGVDPYSRNKVLQDELAYVARADYFSGLGVGAALAFVPGTAGTILATSGTGKKLNDALRSKPPTDLRIMNREILMRMGASEDMADAFINKNIYSPTDQTLLIAALDEMKNTKDRMAFLNLAMFPTTPNQAYLLQRMADLQMAYDKKVGHIKQFVPLNNIALALTDKNELLFNTPLDYLIWSPQLEKFANAADAKAKKLNVPDGKKLFWLTGTCSGEARKQLQKRGWKVKENSGSVLLGNK